MNDFPFYPWLQRALPAQVLPWVTAALRQDGLIWRCLQDPDFRARALARTSPPIDQAEAWSPAALALLALDLPHTPLRLSSDIHYPLESRLRKKVAAAARRWAVQGAVQADGTQAGSLQPPASPGVEDLVQAGLLALALRERRRLTGSWNGLPQEFLRSPFASRSAVTVGPSFSFWLTPLACLFGLVPDPQDLLFALLPPGASADLHRLALHALLAHPLPPEKTAEIVQSLFLRLLPADGANLLSRLAATRPSLAAELADFAGARSSAPDINSEVNGPSQISNSDGLDWLDPLEDLATLAGQLHGAQARQFAGRPAQALPLLQAARETCLHLHAELTAGIALSASGHDPVGALAAWEQAVGLAPENMAYRAGLILALLSAGRVGEARQWLGEEDSSQITDPFLAYAASRLAADSGEIDRARLIARILFEFIKEPEAGNCEGRRFPPDVFPFLPPSALPKLLMELGLMEEAACAARRALDARPTDVELLALEGQAWKGAGKPEAAVLALQISVSLAPDRPDLHRQLAAALEVYGDWQAALEHRIAVAAVAGPEMGADLRDLAACALQAGFPQQAIEACHSALDLDGEDGLAHQFMGQALASTGDPHSAQEHYLQATRLAPALVEPWLALARLQQESGQAQRALDTLRLAAQALPDSAEVHLALGEAFLGDDATTRLPGANSAPDDSTTRRELRAGPPDYPTTSPAQALAYFQRAAALSPASVRIALRLGSTLHKLGHLLEARQALEHAYQAEPAYPGLAHAYALVLAALGDLAGALPVLASLAANPAYAGDASLHLAYGRALMAVGNGVNDAPGSQDSRTAAQAFRRVLELSPGCAEAQASLAEALAAAGDLPAAMQAFQTALGAQSAPETGMVENPSWQARLSLGLGRVALALGQSEIAVASLQEAYQADPHDPAIAQSLAEACSMAGLLDQALLAARTALRLAPDDLFTLAWFAEQAARWIDTGGASGSASPAAASGLAPDQSNLTPSAVSVLRTEAANALARAIQIAPRRADLLVRLGRVQLLSGDRPAALHTFHEVAAAPHASRRDLFGAAGALLELEDPAGAVACLEKAISLVESEPAGSMLLSAPPLELCELRTLLATAYESAGNASAALSTLEAAIAEAPGDLSLYRAKARLLKGLGRRDETLACLHAAIQLAPSGDGVVHDLHYEAARLLRSAGDLPGALSHTNRILSSHDPANPCPYLLPAQVLAAELAHSMLLPERARSILDACVGDQVASSQGAKCVLAPGTRQNSLDNFQYFCLRAELALDCYDDGFATESLNQASLALSGSVRADGEGLAETADGGSPSFSILQARLLAIRARLSILHGDKASALEIAREAAAAALSAAGPRVGPQAGMPLAGLLSIAEAAFLLDQWETAVQCFQAAVEAAPHEPISQLSLARALVLCAETERLYSAVDAVRHAPGAASLSRRAYTAFERAIDAAHQQVSQWLPQSTRAAGEGRYTGSGRRPSRDEGQGSETPWPGAQFAPEVTARQAAPARPAVRSAPYRRSDVIQAQTIVSRWRARGQAVFQPGSHSAQALSATLAILPPSPEDVAAQIAALRLSAAREGGPVLGAKPAPDSGAGVAFRFVPEHAAIAAQAARAYPQHPLVLVQLALILAENKEHPGASPDALAAATTAAREAVAAAGATASLGQEGSPPPSAGLGVVCSALLARLAQSAGEVETARQAIGHALQDWPDQPRWQALAAEIALSSCDCDSNREGQAATGGDLEAAVAHLEEAVRLEPGHLPHFLSLGRAYLRQAIQAGWKALPGGNSQPEAAQAWHADRREELPEEQPVGRAIHTLEEACRLSPGQPEPWLALAVAQRAGGVLDRAAESAGHAIDLAPGEFRPRALRAEIAMQAGDPQTAYEHLAAAMQFEGAANHPTFGQFSLLLARSLDRLDRPVEALSILEKAMPRLNQPLPLLLGRIRLLRKIHGPKVGMDALQQLAAQHPAEPLVMEPLAFELAEAGQEEAAIRVAQSALQAMAQSSAGRELKRHAAPEDVFAEVETPRPAGLHALLGRLLSGAGQLDGAIHHLYEAIRLEPRSLDPYLELGRALQERRQHAQALQIYSSATRIAPRDPRPYYQAGLALRESKDYLGAENMLRRASSLAPADLNIHRQLGAVVALNLIHNRTGARQNV